MAVKTRIATYMAEAHLSQDLHLLFTCKLGVFGTFVKNENEEANLMLALLKLNSLINPFAITVIEEMNVERASADESDIAHFDIVMTDKVPAKDMDPSELISAVESLISGINIFETEILPLFFDVAEIESDIDDDGDDDDFDIDDMECEVYTPMEAVEDAALLGLIASEMIVEAEPEYEEHSHEGEEPVFETTIPIKEEVTPEPAPVVEEERKTYESPSSSESYSDSSSSYDSGGSDFGGSDD